MMKSIEQESSRSGFADIREYLVSLHQKNMKPKKREHILDANQHTILPELHLRTKYGRLFCGDSSSLMKSRSIRPGSVDLIMTSPPFGLVTKKAYGNEAAKDYIQWFREFANGFSRVLKPSGSLVIDIGGSWEPGKPVRSLYHFELLIMLAQEYGFKLAQEFYWWNPSKLPAPAEWVNVRRIRVKDAVNCIWWLSLSSFPKASNLRVLQPYSESM